MGSCRITNRLRRRAVDEEDKQARRGQILAAARLLFDKSGGRLATVDEVAARARIAKGTVYLYFRTKEELYVALYEELLIDLLAKIRAAAASDGVRARVVEAICAFTAERPELLRLASLLNSVLEHNASEEFLHAYKSRLASALLATATRLGEALPDLSFEQLARLLLQTYAFSVGLWQQADLPAVVQSVFRKHAELSLFHVDFATELRHGLNLLWDSRHGAEART